MTQLTDDIISFEVPEGAINFRIMKFSQPENFSYDYPIEKGDRCTTGLIAMIDLPPGSWRILCTTRTCTPNQSREITGEQLYPSIALAGMCKAKGLDERKNYVLLKRVITPA